MEPIVGPMSIGEFAQLSRLSARALRLYDASGLLPPARVDPETGYRWYEGAQLDRARWIARLRELQIPLDEIGALVELAPPQTAARLREHGARLRRDADARTALIEHLAARLEGHRRHPMDVHTRDVPARRLLTCAKRLTSDEVERFATPLFARYAGADHPPRPAGIAGAPFLRYHGELGPDTDALVEFCCPLTEDADPGRGAADGAEPLLAVVREEAHRCAYVEVTARDSGTSLPIEVLGDWIAEDGATPRRAPEQIILAGARDSADDAVVYQFAVPIVETA